MSLLMADHALCPQPCLTEGGSSSDHSRAGSNQISFLHLLVRTLMEVFFPSFGYLNSSDWAFGPTYTYIWASWPFTPISSIAIFSIYQTICTGLICW